MRGTECARNYLGMGFVRFAEASRLHSPSRLVRRPRRRFGLASSTSEDHASPGATAGLGLGRGSLRLEPSGESRLAVLRQLLPARPRLRPLSRASSRSPRTSASKSIMTFAPLPSGSFAGIVSGDFDRREMLLLRENFQRLAHFLEPQSARRPDSSSPENPRSRPRRNAERIRGRSRECARWRLRAAAAAPIHLHVARRDSARSDSDQRFLFGRVQPARRQTAPGPAREPAAALPRIAPVRPRRARQMRDTTIPSTQPDGVVAGVFRSASRSM